MDWRFYLGVWYGLRKSLEFVEVRDREKFSELEKEVLERLEVELDGFLGFPLFKPQPVRGEKREEGEEGGAGYC